MWLVCPVRTPYTTCSRIPHRVTFININHVRLSLVRITNSEIKKIFIYLCTSNTPFSNTYQYLTQYLIDQGMIFKQYSELNYRTRLSLFTNYSIVNYYELFSSVDDNSCSENTMLAFTKYFIHLYKSLLYVPCIGYNLEIVRFKSCHVNSCSNCSCGC